MAAIQWNNSGERFYETGIDRAVLYVNGQSPVNWNGLLSVTHNPTGGESEASYYNGVKFVDTIYKQEFKASIKAYSAPSEFDVCNGNVSMYYGFTATNQNRETFNLSYRTKIGNDVEGVDKGYKIHLIFNASTYASNSEFISIANRATPNILTWTISAIPPKTDGYLATAYRVIDSRKYSLEIMTDLENILYGTDSSEPYFPTANELTTLLGG